MACAALSISIGMQFMPWNLEMRDAGTWPSSMVDASGDADQFYRAIFIYPNALPTARSSARDFTASLL